MSPNFDIPKKPEKETLEEVIERARKLSEEAEGVPKIKEADLFGGETSDEIKPTTKRRKAAGIARAQKNSGPKNERRRGNIQLERMLPSGDR